MKKKTNALFLTCALGALVLSGCSLPSLDFSIPDFSELTQKQSEESSNEKEETSSKESSDKASSSKSSSSKTASSRPSSSNTPSSSGYQTSSSSKQSSSSSQISSSSFSYEEPEIERYMSIAKIDFVVSGGINFLKIEGEMRGFTSNSGKFALGLQHVDSSSHGLTDENDGQWLIGSDSPASRDYKYTPTLFTDNTYEVMINLSNITFIRGAYLIYAGADGFYQAITISNIDFGGSGTVRQDGFNMVLRNDVGLLFVEELPPVFLTESSVIEENGLAILKIGGELGNITAEEFLALNVKVTCERQIGLWKQNVIASEKISYSIEGTNAYILIDISALDEGGYQIKLGFDGISAPNTEMDCDGFDMRDNPTVIGNKGYAPFYAPNTVDKANLFGCCGLFITHAHTFARQEEKIEDSDLYQLEGCTCDTVAYELDIEDENSGTLSATTKLKTTASWDISGIQSGKYDIYISGYSSSQTTHGINFQEYSLEGSDSRYAFQAGSNDVEFITNTKTAQELGWGLMTEGEYRFTKQSLASIMISDADETFSLLFRGNGYSAYIKAIRFVKVGDYLPPSTKLLEETTKIEAENSHIESSSNAGTITEDESLSGGYYVKDLTSTGTYSTRIGERTYNVKAQSDVNVKIRVSYKSQYTGGFIVLVDGVELTTLGQSVVNDFTVVETPDSVLLTKGEHRITLRGVVSSKVDLDYLEIVKMVDANHNHMGEMLWGEAVEATDGLCAYTPGTCFCGKTGVKIMAGDDLNGNLTTGGKITKGTSGSYDPTKTTSYKFNSPVTGKAYLYAEAAIDSGCYPSRGFYSGKDGSMPFDYNEEDETHPTNTIMKMNGNEITLPIDNYGTLLGTEASSNFRLFKVAEVDVVMGENEFNMAATNSFGLLWNYFAFVM